MPLTIIEKIFASHASRKEVTPGEIVNINIDTCSARSYEGAGIISQLRANNLSILDPLNTYLTFDCSPSMREMKYFQNQKICKDFAAETNLQTIYANEGIGIQVLMERGSVLPGSTFICTSRNAVLLGAIGAFGQGMPEKDVAAVFARRKLWFKTPRSVKIMFRGSLPEGFTAKDIGLNLIKLFGPSKLLGAAVELYGEPIQKLSLDERITLAGMAQDTGALVFLIPPSEPIYNLFPHLNEEQKANTIADEDASYAEVYNLQTSEFSQLAVIPGSPPETTGIDTLRDIKIGAAYLGGFSNGHLDDLRLAAKLLRGRQIAPGILLKIVTTTTLTYNKAKEEGLIDILENAGAVVSENFSKDFPTVRFQTDSNNKAIISTGIRYILPELSSTERYISSPSVVISSAIAGYIASPSEVQAAEAAAFIAVHHDVMQNKPSLPSFRLKKPTVLEGKVWFLNHDNISAETIIAPDLIIGNEWNTARRFILQKLEGYENFGRQVKEGDIIVTGKNFGRGNSAQKAVAAFKSIGIALVLAESFSLSFEREAINAAFPIMTYLSLENLDLLEGDMIKANLETGDVINITRKKAIIAERCSDIQLELYQQGGLLSQV